MTMNTDPLRSINWYKNPNSRDCFGVSLANLLLFREDAETAQQVHERYQRSELRDYGGLPMLVASRAVHELTDGRYQGKAHFNARVLPCLLGLEYRLHPIVQEEIRAGRACPTGGKPNYNSYRYPAIVLTTKRSGDGHALVATGERCDCCHYPVLIDDGRVRHSLVSPTPSIGIVEVSPA